MTRSDDSHSSGCCKQKKMPEGALIVTEKSAGHMQVSGLLYVGGFSDQFGTLGQ